MQKSVRKSLNAINKNLNYVRKASEGDKRVIFGKPSTFSGGEWHADEGGQAQDQIDEATEFGQAQDEVDQFTSNMEQALAKLSPEERAKAEERFGLKPSTPEEDQSVIDNKLTAMEGVLQSMGIETEDTAGEFEKQFGINPLENPNATPEKIRDMIEQNDIPDDSGNRIDEIFNNLSEEEKRDMLEFSFDNADELIESGQSDEYVRDLLNNFSDDELDETFGEVKESNMNNPVQKSLNTINKNLAGVHDALQKNGVTSTNDDHSHSYQLDRDGNGATTGMVGELGVQHIHDISNFEVKPAQNHTHYI